MPEIAEVARIVHFLRLHVVGKRISQVSAPDDTVVFGKTGTTGPQIEAAAKGKKVVSAGNQGKYFWITFDKPPHLVMHFGMTGWLHIEDEKTAYTSYYNRLKPGDKDLWPPRFWKFHFETDCSPPVRAAFTDPRRLGRVRVVDCPGTDIRNHSPLVENGPDPVVDTDIFTEDFLRRKIRSRKVPIKALLLDQRTISGIGNWVADEVLFQARVHPELYCDQFSDAQIRDVYEAIRYVCQTAVDKLGDSDEFPKDWIFHYRWGKGKKTAGCLPSGEKLAFLTVGGRTSCYAPALQKKTGAVAGDLDAKVEDIEEEPSKKAGKKEATVKDEADATPDSRSRGRSTGRATPVKKEEDEDEVKDVKPPASEKRTRKRKGGASTSDYFAEVPSPPTQKKTKRLAAPTQKVATARTDADAADEGIGRRRSGRLRNAPVN